MFKSHVALGFLVGLAVTQLIPLSYPIVFIALVTVFSGMPDLDAINSKWANKLWFIAKPIHFIFGHRGFFHSIFPAIGLFLVFYGLGFGYLGLVIFFGWVAHLLGDCVSKEGVAFFYPFSQYRVQGPMRVNSFMESIVFLLLVALDVFYTLKIFQII
ncbi:metal-dependent hydrolase [Candidatus Woesearchaeota archaeon]|nr:metal-dependent hydrolase [Candidatus Woesearchaeota archaeon]